MNPRHERTARLIGLEALERILHSHALVAGLGGVGGMCAEALARGGVGRLTLIDCDVAVPSNINRQVVAVSSTIGIAKAELMRGRVLDIAPDIAVDSQIERLLPETVYEKIETARPDIVLDCIDDVPAKAALIIACERLGVPVISCMGAGNRLDPSMLRVGNLFSITHDPLARALRKRLRAEGLTSLNVVYSVEEPRKPAPPAEGRASTPASSPTVPPAAGLLMAAEALKLLGGYNG